MKFAQPWGRQRLSFLLEKAASREAQTWRGYVAKKQTSQSPKWESLQPGRRHGNLSSWFQDADVSPAQRDEAVRWLTELHGRLQLYPETLVLAVSILDRFLAPIKVRPKYLRCIAVACFFLAAKTCEEDECVPSLKELAASSNCGCSPSEILRMERLILDKLDWDLHTATALDFLHIFHAMATASRCGFLDSIGLNRSQHLGLLTRRLYACLADHALMQLRGSVLALALLSLELETCCPDWLALTIDLLRKAQMDSSALIRSRELVSRSLSTPRASLPPNTVYIYHPLQLAAPARRPLGTMETPRDQPALPQAAAGEESKAPPPSPKHLAHLQKVPLRCKASTKRKVEQMDVDDFYDGIKRLYNEDATSAVHEGATPGGGAYSGGSSPCPPLQPVGAS
ncbi:PREDICTED: cyclin-I-like isoform X1 [Poecilia mexicana]|uniref:cyclin-I-like isoform X1 n=1 Tax=Poecilia mexicana TaxID=48701 RepID=UPI00072E3AEB|nr:PREDICTED: cyclin-I-like isoform X1 [Poecilia mexicana]XP_014855444.1 PREDICTED: cyclin-I-like isoform X1 [Poecilia mexicana]